MSHQEKIDKLYKSGKTLVVAWVDEDAQNLSSWLTLGTSLAEIIEKYDDISGAEKKSLVVQTVMLIINDKDVIPMDDVTRDNVAAVIKLALPTTLDLLIKATKGEIKINKKKCKSFLCFECISKE